MTYPRETGCFGAPVDDNRAVPRRVNLGLDGQTEESKPEIGITVVVGFEKDSKTGEIRLVQLPDEAVSHEEN